jgi:peptide chain release factor 2
LQEKTLEPHFWDDPPSAQETLKEIRQRREEIEPWRQLEREIEDLQVLAELGREEGDASLQGELEEGLARVRQRLEQLELATMLNGEYDSHDAILRIKAGSGGTEAQDWAEMLLRMYLRWCERRGFQGELIEVSPGEEAGIKTAILLVHGRNAYGYLRSEKGTHRLVRLSPFDFNNRRHTSFAGVDVLPDLDEEITVDIDEKDLKIETYRSSGAGGQHVNKTDSAVRITHLPTGIVVQCQNERSQHKNRAVAMKVLRAKLYDLMQQEKKEQIAELRGQVEEYAWGNQIRNYVLHPYQLVKDLRTNVETSQTEAVLDGDIDLFIEAYLRQNAGRNGNSQP